MVVPFILPGGRLKTPGVNALQEKSGEEVTQVTVGEGSPVLLYQPGNPGMSLKSPAGEIGQDLAC